MMKRTCIEISELLSEGMDRSLRWHERLAIRLHLIICKSCYRFSHQVQFLRKAARRYK